MELPCKLLGRSHCLRRTLIIFALLCIAALQPAIAQSFSIQNLGTLANGFTSQATGINNRGQIVGTSETNGLFQPHAFSALSPAAPPVALPLSTTAAR